MTKITRSKLLSKIPRLFCTLTITLLSFSLNAPGYSAAQKSLYVCDDVEQPKSLNPYVVFSEKVHTVLQQILEGLVRFDEDGQIEPALANRWERIDEHTMRFFLRKGVKFHNGEAFDAESVKFSLEKFVDPETRYPGIGFVSTIKQVDIVDPHTVDVKTHIPDGLILNRLAAWVHIVPKAYFEKVGGEGYSDHPVGTGAFQFSGRVSKEDIVFTAFDDYWVPGAAKFEKLVFRFIPSDEQLAQLLKGEIDIVTELPGTRTIDVVKSKKTKIVKRETYYTITCALSVNDGPLKSQKVRQAINYAINRADLVRYDALGNARVIATFSMPGEEGHDETLKPYPYDPKKAKQLIREAGFEGKPIVLKALVKDQALRATKIMKKQLERVGVTIDIHVTTDNQMLANLAKGGWNIMMGAVPDPMCHTYFIQSIDIYSKSPFSLGKHEKFDSMLEDMVMTLDAEERIKKAKAIDRLIYDEALSIFTYQRIRTYGVNKKLTFKPSVTGMPYFYRVGIREN